MRINLILVLTFACNAAGSLHKRASVLTDESKRILDMFDFSNFDKQEALSCIDRQRFENLIRGKRSKWYLTQNLLNSNSKLTSVDYENYNIQHEGYESLKGMKSDKNTQKGLPKGDKLKVHSRSDSDHNEGITLESFQLSPPQNGLRRTRSAKSAENMKGIGQNNSELTKNNDTIIERNELKVKHPDGDSENNDTDDDDEGDKDDRSEKRRRIKRKKKRHHHWSKWTEWSPCSVTCGKGRKIRSRKCIAKSCASGEIEMGEKTCQLPACSLFDKLFSFWA